jgi:hypothetical protein
MHWKFEKFFSRKRRRAALHYIKKRIKGKSPYNTTQTHTHTPTQTDSRITFEPETPKHKTTTTELDTLTTREEGSQERKPSSPSHRPQAAFLASQDERFGKVRGRSIKNTTITMVPNSPSSKNDK